MYRINIDMRLNQLLHCTHITTLSCLVECCLVLLVFVYFEMQLVLIHVGITPQLL